MAPLRTTIEVACPAEQAFAYVTDPTHFPEWQANVTSGSMDGSPPYRPGERCLTTRRIGGGERQITAEITHIDPPRRWGVRGVDGPIRSIVAVTVEADEDRDHSRVIVDLDFTGHGVGKLLVPLLVRRQARREMPANMRRLKERLESSSDSPQRPTGAAAR